MTVGKSTITLLLIVLGSATLADGRAVAGESSKIAELLGESLHRDLILYYSFNRNDGTKVVDISGMDFHGKVHGAKWIAAGASGGATSFDGEDDHIEIREISLRAFTFSAWVKVTDSEDSGSRYRTIEDALRSNLRTTPMFFRRGRVGINNRRIFLLSGGGDRCYALQGNVGGSIGIYVTDNLEVNEYDWQFSSGGWTHVAVTHDGRTFKIYRNGKLTETGGIETDGVSGTLYIGGTNERRGNFWCGDIDEVAIFNRALRDEEVKQVFELTGFTDEMAMMPEVTSLRRFAGEWTGLAVDKPGYGTSRDSLALRLHIDNEGQLYGEASGRFVRDGFAELEDLKVSGNRISCTVRHRFMGMLMAITAELRGDELLGEGVPIDRDDDHCNIKLRRISREDPAEYTPSPGRRKYILHYSFDREEGQTVRDQSDGGNHGRLEGARYESNGMIGGAMSFNGSGDHIAVPDVYLEEFSLLVWIKTPLTGRSVNNRRIFTTGDGTHYYALQGNVRGGLSIVADGEEINEYDWQFEANRWTHITLTHGRGTFKLYKDGSLTETGQMVSGSVGGSLFIGGTGRHRGHFWRGMMDEVTILNRALNEIEVKQFYDNQHYEVYGRPRRVSGPRPRPEPAMGLERLAGLWSGMAIDKPEEGTSRDALKLELQVHASGQLVGQASGRFVHGGTCRLENSRVSGNQLYFEVYHRYRRMRMGITLYLQGDKLVGEGIPIDIDEDRCDITLEREPSVKMKDPASGPVVASPRPNNTDASIVNDPEQLFLSEQEYQSRMDSQTDEIYQLKQAGKYEKIYKPELDQNISNVPHRAFIMRFTLSDGRTIDVGGYEPVEQSDP